MQRWLKTIKYLPEFGVEPYVLSVDLRTASYPQLDRTLMAEVPDDLKLYRTPTHEVLGAYKRLSPDKQIPYGGFANEGRPTAFQKVARFVRGNFFLPDPRRGWNASALSEAVSIIKREKIDAIITTGPPHSTHLIGLELKKKFPALRWIADLRDPWTDIYYNKALYQLPIARKINLNYERSVLLAADHLVTVSGGVRDGFCAHAPVADKFSVIPNGYDEDDFKDVLPAQKPSGRLVLSYIGTLSPLYDIDALAEALKLVPRQRSSELLLRLVGGVSPGIAAELSKLPVELEFVAYQQHRDAIGYMMGSDLLLLLLPREDGRGVLTGKFFEYLASGRPILLIGDKNSELAAYVEKFRAGRVFEPGRPSELADFLLASMSELPKGADPAEIGEFSRRALARKFAELVI